MAWSLKVNDNDRVSRFYRELDASFEFIDKKFRKRARLCYSYYDAENKCPAALAATIDSESWVRTNYAFSTANTIATNIFSRNPTILVTHETEKNSVFARVTTKAVNFELGRQGEEGFKDVGKQCAIDAIVTGAGLAKVGYEVKFRVNEDRVRKLERERESLAKTLRGMGMTVPGTPEYDEAQMARAEIESRIDLLESTLEEVADERIVVDHENILAIRVPRSIRSLKTCPWMSFEYLRTPSEIEDKYGVRVQGLVYNDDGEVEKTESAVSSPNPDDRKESELQVKIHEYWDRRTKKVYTLLDKAHKLNDKDGGVLKVIGDPYALPLFFPVNLLRFNTSPNRFFPLSDIWNIKPQLDVINAVRSTVNDHARRFVRRYVYNKGHGVSDEEMDTFLNSGDGSVKGLNFPASFPIRNAIAAVEDAPINSETYAAARDAIGDIYQILGIPDFERGGVSKTKTATEADYMQSSSMNKTGARVDAIEDFTAANAMMILRLMLKYYSAGKVMEMAGDGAFEADNPEELITAKMDFTKQWGRFKESGEDIFRELKLKVIPGSTLKPNKETKQQFWKELLATAARYNRTALEMAKIFPGKTRFMNPEKILLEIMRLEDANVKDVDDYFIGVEDAMLNAPAIPPQETLQEAPGSNVINMREAIGGMAMV